jgi:predicted aspartyl protease
MSLPSAHRIDFRIRRSVSSLKILRLRIRRLGILFGVLTMVPIAICGAARSIRPTQLSGYKAVPVHYGPLNKMIMSVNIDGQPANLLVDTGANQIILDASAAESLGVRPSQRRLTYIALTEINGQLLPVAFVRSLTAGSMSFGSNLVALLPSGARSSFSSRWGDGGSRVNGALGADILVRHKAVINCRTQFIFLKTDRSRPSQIAAFALSEKFTKIPLRREENGAFTVPCSIHGQAGRLVVDTGGFVTTFNEATVKSLGISLQSTRTSARFTSGVKRPISIGQFNDLMIGDFKVPAAKFGVAMLPNFVLAQGNTRGVGILGMDLLYKARAIIDFDSMSLFLK